MRKMYYIGSHMGEPDDGYICSSKWMQRAYARRPDDFKRRIIYVLPPGNTHYQLLEEEFRTLQMIRSHEMGTRYYNRSTIVGFGTLKGGTLSAESRAKISASRQGKSTTIGQKRSEETKEKLRQLALNRPQLTFAGQKHTPETCAKMGDFHRGKPLSEAHKEKLRVLSMGNKYSVGKRNWLGKHHTEETKTKIGAKSRGRKHDEATLQKMRDVQSKRIKHPATGLIHSEESRRKMSIGQKRRKKPTDAKGRFIPGTPELIEQEQTT